MHRPCRDYSVNDNKITVNMEDDSPFVVYDIQRFCFGMNGLGKSETAILISVG